MAMSFVLGKLHSVIGLHANYEHSGAQKDCNITKISGLPK